MASLARGPPPFLKPEPGQASPTHGPTADAELSTRAGPRDVKTIPQPHFKGGFGTPANTPANPPPVAIAPRMGGGRPIGLALNRAGAGAGAPHAATPGNTPSSLETMGRRIVGKLQDNGGNGGNGGQVGGGQGGGNGARIAPSYERRFTAGLQDLNSRLTTHPEKSPAIDSPSSSMGRLQIVSPTSTEQGQKADWPTSFDTDTNEGEGQGQSRSQASQRVLGVRTDQSGKESKDAMKAE